MPPTLEEFEECRALRRLFEERSKLSQRKFAEMYGLGTSGNIGHYLNGRRALGLDAASRFAKGLGVAIGDFSPRLAAKVLRLSDGEPAAATAASDKAAPAGGSLWTVPFVSGGEAVEAPAVAADGSLPRKCLAFSVRDAAMEPVFRKGDTVIVDPGLKPGPGDFTLARVGGARKDAGSLVFGKYRLLGKDPRGRDVFELVPLNPDYPSRASAAGRLRTVGVAVELRRRLAEPLSGE